MKHYDYIAQCIKEVGQMLIDNCEDYAGKTDGMSDFHINIWFPEENYNIPEIEITKTYVPDFKIADRLIDLKRRVHRYEDASVVKSEDI